jgi:hypothetical protein
MLARLILAAALVLSAGAAQAQHGAAQPAPKAGETRSLQGRGEQVSWADNPNMKAFYELTKASFAGGWKRVDFPTYQEKSFALFRELGKSMGAPPEAMVDHLKAVPGQMLQIVGDDPHALDSYETFRIAMMGPD